MALRYGQVGIKGWSKWQVLDVKVARSSIYKDS